MSPLSLFIIFIITITFTIARYTFFRLKDTDQIYRNKQTWANKHINYWKNAETTNGRLAMMGFLAIVVNYGLFGWIIPGFF